jgi:multidrug efflux system membrane fusion protein
MAIKRSYLFGGAVLGVLVGYFVLRGLLGGDKPQAAPAKVDPIPVVQTELADAAERPYAVVVRGRTEAPRTVQVRAATAGVVAETPTPQGTYVHAGRLLCRQAVDAREASLDKARAKLRSVQLQYQANQKLEAKGYRSETQVLAAKADLDQAAADVRQAEVTLEQMNIRAPFDGVFDRRDAEVGAYLAPGQSCGTVIELDPLLFVGDVSETEAARLTAGAGASAKLTTGQIVTGHIRYVARQSDPQTRTYRVEMIAANPGAKIAAGLSAEIRIDAGQGEAHLVPVTALVLDAAGRQGVRFVQPSGLVGFAPVKVVEETPQGVWISGLSGPVRVIVVGQSYVSEGQRVRIAAR